MLKNKKFGAYTIAFCILGIVYMFMYSGLQNDQINIIQGFVTSDGGGWSSTMTQLPMTVGNVVCILLTFVYGTFFIKYGVRKTLIPCIILSAIGCVGIAAANGLDVYGGASAGIYWLFFISLFVVRCTCMCLQMAGFQLAASWFIRYRGRVLGIITLGSPLFSVVGTSVMTNLIANHMGNDYRGFYIGIAVVLGLIALLTRCLLKDTPEEAGLYPDGADHAPISEQDADDEIHLTVGQVLSEKRAWLLIISYGAFQFIINACMGSMAVRYITLGGLDVWIAATKWLAVGAIVGIPMSYVFGWLDDKLGTVVASIILGLTELIPVIALWSMPVGGNVALEVIWGFGVACMTGGVPTMHPCSVTYGYGRREYQSANRVIMAIQLIPSAVAALMMTTLIEAGKASIAYIILLAIIIIGLIATIMMRSIPDANAADRDFAKSEKA
jgi:MFS family permease